MFIKKNFSFTSNFEISSCDITIISTSDSLIACLRPSSLSVGSSVTSGKPCWKAANAVNNHSGQVSEKIKIL